MSVNNYRPHLLVIPEDDANRQLANGFALGVLHGRRVQILPEAGGWTHVCEDFLRNHANSMRKFTKRYVVMLLDFDDNMDRRSTIEGQIPLELRDRVFLLGVRSEPEALRRSSSGTFESIGLSLAHECRDEIGQLWQHELLLNNSAELERLRSTVRPFLFDPD